jgi:hypothetical protein
MLPFTTTGSFHRQDTVFNQQKVGDQDFKTINGVKTEHVSAKW